jgi:hypothetical protein
MSRPQPVYTYANKNKPMIIAKIPAVAIKRSKKFMSKYNPTFEFALPTTSAAHQFQPTNRHIIPNPTKSIMLSVKRLLT